MLTPRLGRSILPITSTLLLAAARVLLFAGCAAAWIWIASGALVVGGVVYYFAKGGHQNYENP